MLTLAPWFSNNFTIFSWPNDTALINNVIPLTVSCELIFIPPASDAKTVAESPRLMADFTSPISIKKSTEVSNKLTGEA
jgi:hypothetical protein